MYIVCALYHFTPFPDPAALRAEFLAIAQELSVDIAFQQDSIFRRNRRLVVFDMDSTLIDAEVIDEDEQK